MSAIPHTLFLNLSLSLFLSFPDLPIFFAGTRHNSGDTNRYYSASSAIPTPSFLIPVSVCPLPSPLSLSHSPENPPFLAPLVDNHVPFHQSRHFSSEAAIYISVNPSLSPLPPPLSLSHSPAKKNPSLTSFIGQQPSPFSPEAATTRPSPTHSSNLDQQANK